MSSIDLLTSGLTNIGTYFFLVGVLPSIILVFIIYLVFIGWGIDISGISIGNMTRITIDPHAGTQYQAGYEDILKHINNFNLDDAILLIIASIVLAVILIPFQTSIIRILEGYWSENIIITPFINLGKKIQRNRLKGIEEDEKKKIKKIDKELQDKLKTNKSEYHDQDNSVAELEKSRVRFSTLFKQRTYFPDENRLLPTALGNVMRASEDSTMKKYGLESVIVWPRLYAILPESMKNILDDQRTKVDLSTRLCLIFIFSFIISSPFLLKLNIFLSIPIFCLILAWLTYNGSISACLIYGQGIQTAFDLYRFDLLTSLHLKLPFDRRDEIILNKKVSTFLGLGLTDRRRDFTYKHDDTYSD